MTPTTRPRLRLALLCTILAVGASLQGCGLIGGEDPAMKEGSLVIADAKTQVQVQREILVAQQATLASLDPTSKEAEKLREKIADSTKMLDQMEKTLFNIETAYNRSLDASGNFDWSQALSVAAPYLPFPFNLIVPGVGVTLIEFLRRRKNANHEAARAAAAAGTMISPAARQEVANKLGEQATKADMKIINDIVEADKLPVIPPPTPIPPVVPAVVTT